MKLCIQRVHNATVVVENKTVGQIQKGLLVFIGIGRDDEKREAEYLADKCVNMRIFEDENGKMNLSVKDIGGKILIVSQFTLYGSLKKGKRPNFLEAAPPEKGEQLYEYFCSLVEKEMGECARGVFGAHMDVSLVNDGPVTILVDSK